MARTDFNLTLVGRIGRGAEGSLDWCLVAGRYHRLLTEEIFEITRGKRDRTQTC